MKNLIFAIGIIFVCNIYSQKNYRIEYSAIVKFDENITNLNKKFSIMQNSEEDIKNSNFYLEFNEKESFFYTKFPVEVNKIDKVYLNTLTHSEKLVYTSLDSLLILNEKNNESKNEKFFVGNDKILIVNKVIKDWEITTESKKIDNYVCYKAINYTIEEVKNKQIMRTITAWFCPEIPLSFGPAKYSGLPGLIFEVSEGFLKYELKKIEPIEIIEYTKPKGKRMTIYEYIEIFNKKINDLNEMAKTLKKD
jgi:GLPGLI family protein